METAQANAMENFLNSWNNIFPKYEMTVPDLKKPHSLMSALFQLFDRLGIDNDAILSAPAPEDRNENTVYYWDLLPVIKVTQVINHLVTAGGSAPQAVTISIIYFLQPNTVSSHSILMLLCNLMFFYEDKLSDIAPEEEILFVETDKVKALEEEKNRLLEMFNKHAEEKAKRAERLEKMHHDIKQFEEDLKLEKEVHDEKRQELEASLKENRQTEMLLDQKKSHMDTLMTKIARRKALRVYDAEDIIAQSEQAAQNMQELEQKLDSLEATLKQKENSLKNLQTLKPNLDTANNLLHEIMKLSDNLKDFETGDLDTDSQEGELDVLNTELGEMQAQLSELQMARDDAAKKRSKSQALRQHEKTLAYSSLREAEEKDRKMREKSKMALHRTAEIKELTTTYEAEKTAGIEELATIKNNFSSELKATDETLLKKLEDAKKTIEEKLRNRTG